MSAVDTATERVIGWAPLKVLRRVRWGECDPAGVVYTVNFCEFVSSAFELFMTELLGGPLQAIKKQHGFAVPARALTLDFLGALQPDDQFVMTVLVDEVRTRTFDLGVTGTCSGRDIFKARLTPISVDPNRTAIPIPELLRQQLNSYKTACRSAS
jgi:4-hydroxybenzoyl-CoA thioesterase